MIRVMFLCTGNSCRSQMAEGLARVLGKGLVDAHSAGLTPTNVHERAVAVMQEIGIDISDQEAKEIDPDFLLSMDIIITLCGNAEASCPMTPPHIRRIHWPIDDPAVATGTEVDAVEVVRQDLVLRVARLDAQRQSDLKSLAV